jgi:hypothetical protein
MILQTRKALAPTLAIIAMLIVPVMTIRPSPGSLKTARRLLSPSPSPPPEVVGASPSSEDPSTVRATRAELARIKWEETKRAADEFATIQLRNRREAQALAARASELDEELASAAEVAESGSKMAELIQQARESISKEEKCHNMIRRCMDASESAWKELADRISRIQVCSALPHFSPMAQFRHGLPNEKLHLMHRPGMQIHRGE